MEKELINITEIWQETDGVGDGLIEFHSNKQYKIVGLLANGFPLKLNDGFIILVNKKSKEEVDNIK